MIYCIFFVRWFILQAHREGMSLRCTLTRRLFRGPSSRSSCSWIVTGYLAGLDGSIGKDAVVAAMMNNKEEKEEEEEEEEEEGEEGVLGMLVERTTIEIEDRKKGQKGHR